MTIQEISRPRRVSRVLLLGGSRPEPLEAARKAGISLVYVGPKRAAGVRHRELADWLVLFEDEPSDLVEFATALHGTARFEVAVATTDGYVEQAAVINERLGLDANSVDAVRATKDKARMREVFAAARVRPVRSARVRTPDQLTEFVGSVGCPVVVKPVAGTASRHINRIDGPADLARIAPLLDGSEPDGWLAEEFLTGQEFSVETFSALGEHHVLAVTEKFKADNFVEVGHLVPARITEDVRQEIAAEACAALAAVGITEGPGHTEIILTDDGPRVVETHARPGGDAIVELVRLACGADLQQLTFDWLSGKPLAIPPRGPRSGAAAIWFLTADPGTVTDVLGLDEAQSAAGVHEAVLTTAVGAVVGPLNSSADRLGFAIATGPDPDGALTRARAAVDRFDVRVTPHQTSH